MFPERWTTKMQFVPLRYTCNPLQSGGAERGPVAKVTHYSGVEANKPPDKFYVQQDKVGTSEISADSARRRERQANDLLHATKQAAKITIKVPTLVFQLTDCSSGNHVTSRNIIQMHKRSIICINYVNLNRHHRLTSMISYSYSECFTVFICI